MEESYYDSHDLVSGCLVLLVLLFQVHSQFLGEFRPDIGKKVWMVARLFVGPPVGVERFPLSLYHFFALRVV